MILRADLDHGSETKTQTPEPSPVDEVIQALTAVRVHASAYLETRRDMVAAKVRKMVLWAMLGTLAAVIGATALATAVVLTVSGAADGLGVAFGERYWAGKLVVGLVLVSGTAAAAWLFVKGRTRTALRKTVRKYESGHTHV